MRRSNETSRIPLAVIDDPKWRSAWAELGQRFYHLNGDAEQQREFQDPKTLEAILGSIGRVDLEQDPLYHMREDLLFVAQSHHNGICSFPPEINDKAWCRPWDALGIHLYHLRCNYHYDDGEQRCRFQDSKTLEAANRKISDQQLGVLRKCLLAWAK